MANQRCSDESSLKQRSYVVQCALADWIDSRILLSNNKGLMYMQWKVDVEIYSSYSVDNFTGSVF